MFYRADTWGLYCKTLQVLMNKKMDTLPTKLASLLLSVTLTGSDKHSSLPHNLPIFSSVRIRNVPKISVLKKVFQPLLVRYHNRLECLSLTITSKQVLYLKGRLESYT
jgi:hypothetical protein